MSPSPIKRNSSAMTDAVMEHHRLAAGLADEKIPPETVGKEASDAAGRAEASGADLKFIGRLRNLSGIGFALHANSLEDPKQSARIFEHAAGQFTAAAKAGPENHIYYSNLASACALAAEQREVFGSIADTDRLRLRALDYSKKALDLAAGKPGVEQTLKINHGFALAKAGDIKGARALLSQITRVHDPEEVAQGEIVLEGAANATLVISSKPGKKPALQAAGPAPVQASKEQVEVVMRYLDSGKPLTFRPFGGNTGFMAECASLFEGNVALQPNNFMPNKLIKGFPLENVSAQLRSRLQAGGTRQYYISIREVKETRVLPDKMAKALKGRTSEIYGDGEAVLTDRKSAAAFVSALLSARLILQRPVKDAAATQADVRPLAKKPHKRAQKHNAGKADARPFSQPVEVSRAARNFSDKLRAVVERATLGGRWHWFTQRNQPVGEITDLCRREGVTFTETFTHTTRLHDSGGNPVDYPIRVECTVSAGRTFKLRDPKGNVTEREADTFARVSIGSSEYQIEYGPHGREVYQVSRKAGKEQLTPVVAKDADRSDEEMVFRVCDTALAEGQMTGASYTNAAGETYTETKARDACEAFTISGGKRHRILRGESAFLRNPHGRAYKRK